MDGNIEKMQSLTGRIKSLAIDTTLTKKGMCAEAKATGEALATKLNITDIVDELTSVASDKPLSANQGRVLKKQIDEIDPHFAENVVYDESNVKDALDKTQGDIDVLKGTIGYTSKNLIPYPHFHTTMDNNGIKYTDNGDGTINANGTSTAQANYSIKNRITENYVVKKGKYILTGCPQGGSRNTYCLELGKSNASNGFELIGVDSGDGFEFEIEEDTSNVGVTFTVTSGVKLDNVVIKPMIRLASIKDDSYEPYKADVQTQLGEIVEYTIQNATPFSAERNYFIKSKNRLTICFCINLTNEINSTNKSVTLVSDVKKTFGVNEVRPSFALAVTNTNAVLCTIVTNNQLVLEYRGANATKGAIVGGQIDVGVN